MTADEQLIVKARDILDTCLNYSPLEEADLKRAIDAGMLAVDELEHNSVYLGYSPRNMSIATWDAERKHFFVRAVVKGDSQFQYAGFPADGEDQPFVPVKRMAGAREAA